MIKKIENALEDHIESIIAKAELTPEEAKLMRVRLNLPAAGRENSRTRKWTGELSAEKYYSLFRSAEEKIKRFLSAQGAEK